MIFKKLILPVPLLPPALCIIGCVLSLYANPWFFLISLAGLLLPAMCKMWREVILCLILGCLSAGLTIRQKHIYDRESSEFSAGIYQYTEVEGSVIRCLTNTIWLQTAKTKSALEIVPPQNTQPQLGEKWRFRGVGREINPPMVPGAFDRESWLRRSNVIGRFTAIEGECQDQGNLWSRILSVSESWRNQAAGILQEGSSSDDQNSQIMVSLLLGEKRGLEQVVYENFRSSGSLHIFAVSGLHVGIAALLLLGVLTRIGLSPVKARLLAIPMLAFYVFVTGMPISAIRALVMISILFCAMALRQRNNPVNVLALAAIVFLLWNPLQLLDAGFQLSFTIFGVIVLAGMWGTKQKPFWNPDPFIPKRIYTKSERFLVKGERDFRLLIMLSLCCWLAAIPLTVSNFGTFNLYSAITNTIMAPIIPVVMAICMFSILFSWCHPVLIILNQVARFLAGILLFLSQHVAELPAALIPFTLPAQPDQFMVIPHMNGCTVMLGNPGLLINAGSQENIRYTITPALRTEGFTPKALLLTKPRQRMIDGAGELSVSWPHAIQLGVATSLQLPHTLPYPDGGITIYPPAGHMKYGIQDDHNPIILWQHKNKRLLFIGDASYHNALHLPDEAKKADIVMVGKHSKDPVDQVEWLIETGATCIIFLEAPDEKTVNQLKGKAAIYNPRADGTLILSINSN